MPQKLLVINYSMNASDSVFGLQPVVVEHLHPYFSRIDVITNSAPADVGRGVTHIFDLEWRQGKALGNLKKLFKTALMLNSQHKYDVIFYHMTDVHAAVLSPLFRILNKPRQVLWYAHANTSAWLRFSVFFVDSIVSSTKLSFPIETKKLKLLGQAIDTKLFMNKFERDYRETRKLVHIGRIDASKEISTIIESVLKLRHIMQEKICLTFIGDSRSKDGPSYHESLLKKYRDELTSGWLRFLPPVPRSEIPAILLEYDLFIHAFNGSLDKSIVEATMASLPVVTLNIGYREEFGSWSNDVNSDLVQEFLAYMNLSPNARSNILKSRQELAIEKHSFDNWLESLVSILRNDSK